MWGQKRFVNVRGYIFEVKVYGRRSVGDWFCETETFRSLFVPEHLFYHRDRAGFLILRDSVEFRRNSPDHPVHIETLKW